MPVVGDGDGDGSCDTGGVDGSCDTGGGDSGVMGGQITPRAVRM